MKIRPPVKWHGGKHYLARRIIDQFPPADRFKVYVEPYGGCASVLLNKDPSPVEVYNDLDSRIVRLFLVLQHRPEQLARRLALSPYSEELFNNAVAARKKLDRSLSCTSNEFDWADHIDLALWDYVRWRQSIGGRGTAFSESIRRSRRGMADVVSGWLSSIDENLPLVIERLRQVQLLHRPALDVIRKYDSPSTLFYCDPPYLPETREEHSRSVYGIEMTRADHFRLADALTGCKGLVVLSGYRSSEYDQWYSDWRRVDFDMPNHSAGGKSKARRTECLWMNY